MAIGLTACVAPRAGELRGAPAPVSVRVPSAELPAGHRKVTFRWEYRDRSVAARGEGRALVAPPDSARMDFAVSGGMGSGRAWLLEDTIVSPGGDRIKRYLPSSVLLWAALGRLALKPAPDTTMRIDGDTLRADLGGGGTNVWRVAFAGSQLVGVQRLSDGRVRETVVRRSNDDIRFENPAAGRSLTLTHVRSDTVAEIDPELWQH